MAKKDTKVVVAGRRKELTFGIVNPPVFHASTVLFDSYAQLKERAKQQESALYYGRKGTPTHRAFEEAMLSLEGGEGCWTFPSGMAAVACALLSVTRAGDHFLISDNVYEPTRAFAEGPLKAFGADVTFFDPMIGEGIAALFKPNTRAVMLESPGSLTFEIADIPAMTAVARAHGAFSILDNTWATPLLFNGFDHGADIVVHAATKYIVGHSDAMIGTAAANARAWPLLKKTAWNLGQIAAPDDVYLALRGLRTLSVRLRQHEESALHVARWLHAREDVAAVLHPALDDCPGHALWKRDFSGSSGLFSFILRNGDMKNIGALVDGREYFKIGFSWGGYESLILPCDPAGIRSAVPFSAPGPVVRLHIGLENPADLIADLKEGLAHFNR